MVSPSLFLLFTIEMTGASTASIQLRLKARLNEVFPFIIGPSNWRRPSISPIMNVPRYFSKSPSRVAISTTELILPPYLAGNPLL